ncbi:MAG: SDR family oxidoreductase [Anaerocolumna sp.]
MKTILITGGNSERGIGLGTAKRFAKEGWRVVILDLAKEPGEGCRKVIENSNGAYYSCDVSNKAQVDSVMGDLFKKIGFVDVLFNNAGILQWVPFVDVTEEQYDREMNVNLKSMYLVGQPIARKMMEEKRGVIINSGSMGGKDGAAFQSVYAASKGAVIQLTKIMAKELGPYGIRVNSICPGIIQTDIGAGAPDPIVPWIERTPLGRLGDIDDVAGVVWFLANEDSKYLTAQAINITGGMMTF